MSSPRICIVPKVSGVGGMVSFRHRLTAKLAQRGVQVSDELGADRCDAVLVVGGTRQLAGLWRQRQQGARIVQRLDGMNWLHRRVRTGLRHTLRAEYGNWSLNFIRTRLADGIVYQSEFARGWWERAYGAVPAAAGVIHNGVDLSVFTPHGPGEPPQDAWRILLVEGSLMGGYELGLETAFGLAERVSEGLRDAHSRFDPRGVELMVVGRVAPQVQSRYENRWNGQAGLRLTWSGLQPAESIPEIDRSAHLLFSSDLNAACPNSVIEALGCGLPVLAFATGALPELVTGDAGRVVPYGGDPWRLDPPDILALAGAALEILMDQGRFRQAARLRAEAAFNLEGVVDSYLAALLGE